MLEHVHFESIMTLTGSNADKRVTVSPEEENNLIVKSLDWKGLAKKSGIEIGDIVSNFKTENLERPNKAVIYPFAAFLLFIFGLLNYRRS
jgi:hypothetical protein